MRRKKISLMISLMARPQRYTESMLARFAAGTLSRIRAVLDAGEAVADVVREAVDRELGRRERAVKRGQRTDSDESSN